jgi:peptide/nickel transport system substrate-binding protein
MVRCLVVVGLFLSALSGASFANDQELRIGARTEPLIDPHFIWSGASTQFHVQYFGFLTAVGPDDQLKPALAESWKVVSDGLWEFVLRPDLKFDNGQKLTTADVIASFERARTMPKGTFASLFSGVTAIAAVDDRTLHITTSRPYPTLPNSLSQVAIIPASIAKTATNADFTSGRASVGAGLYRFVEFVPGDRLVLERNEYFYGEKARWKRVVFRFLTNNAARVAALLSGDVDLIDGVPPEEVAHLRADARFTVISGPSDRLVYLTVDTERNPTPFITGNDGKPLAKNPLADVRVRRALSLAIDRNAIKAKVMDGLSYPTTQIATSRLGGYAKDIPPLTADIEKAKALLREAGWPDGFQLSLQCPNGRLINDAKLCQVLAQMFGRISVKTAVEVSPYSVYVSRMTNHTGERGSVFMSTWASSYAGENGAALENVLHSYNSEKKLGSWNLGHYDNPEVDALTEKSMATLDPAKRYAIQAEAMAIAMADVGVIPLHEQAVVLAARKGLTYPPYANEYTIANDVRPKESADK